MRAPTTLALFTALLLAAPALAQQAEDAGALVPQFQEGDVITMDQIDKLKPFLPPEFWDNRDFFFYEGMQLEIGPTADYSAGEGVTRMPRALPRASRASAPTTASRTTRPASPSPEEIDCKGDPQAGVKSCGTSTTSGDGDGGAARASSTPTGTAASSSRSTTRAPAKTVKLSHRRREAVPRRRTQRRHLPRREAQERLRRAGRRALRRPRHHAALLPLQVDGQAARRRQERRHLGLRADPAPRAPHLDGPAHRRRLRHRLHVRRPAQLQRHRSRSTSGPASAR